MHEINKGFTLLELLTSIAIIGLLAAITFVYISDARDKGNDTKTKGNLSRARATAELFYNSQLPTSYNGSGGNVINNCSAASSMFTDTTSGTAQYTSLSNFPSNTSLRCSSNGSTYTISASLKRNTGAVNPDFWCVDSRGNSKLIEGVNHAAAHPNGITVCP